LPDRYGVGTLGTTPTNLSESFRIAIEDLKVSGMLKNHKLAQVIADCGFHEFKRQLEYKAKKFGCEIVIADPWFPPLQNLFKLRTYPRYATKRKDLQLWKLRSCDGQRFECCD
jgi:transposase, IS605 OrfB family, central region